MKGEWKRNLTGRCPTPLIATRKRVAVKLRNGMVDGEHPLSSETPAGWLAWSDRHGKACDWSLDGSPFDILEYKVHGE